MVTEEELKGMTPEQIAQMQKENCIFCHIVSGKVSSRKVYADERALAFLDINPANPGHLLLIPKTHQAILPQMPDEEVGHLFRVSKSLSNRLLKSLQVKGTNIFVANGAVAGQKAPHFMIHIIPRTDGDGLNFIPPENEAQQAELDDIKQKLLVKVRQVFGLSDEEMQRLGMKEQEKEKSPDDPQAEIVDEKQYEQKNDEAVDAEFRESSGEPPDEGQEQGKEQGFDFDALKRVLEK